VNVAEIAPLVGDAVDAYLQGYADAAVRLGARWVTVHAGFHFSSRVEQRMEAGLDRLRRLVAYAESRGTKILLENLKQGASRRGGSLPRLYDRGVALRYYEKIQSAAFARPSPRTTRTWCRSVAGFLDLLPLDRVAEVRLADCLP